MSRRIAKKSGNTLQESRQRADRRARPDRSPVLDETPATSEPPEVAAEPVAIPERPTPAPRAGGIIHDGTPKKMPGSTLQAAAAVVPTTKAPEQSGQWEQAAPELGVRSGAGAATTRTTVCLSAEANEALDDLIFDALERTGSMPRKWAMLDVALSEFMPTAEEAAATMNRDYPEDPQRMTSMIQVSTRRKLRHARGVRNAEGWLVPVAWFHTEALNRYIADRARILQS